MDNIIIKIDDGSEYICEGGYDVHEDDSTQITFRNCKVNKNDYELLDITFWVDHDLNARKGPIPTKFKKKELSEIIQVR